MPLHFSVARVEFSAGCDVMSLSRFVGRLECHGKRRAGTLLSGVDQGLELGMGFRDVGRDGADDVDFEVVVFGVLEGGGDEFLGDTAAAKGFGDFGVDEGEPALAIGFKFEIAGLAVLLDLETAAGYLGWVVHWGPPLLFGFPRELESEPVTN